MKMTEKERFLRFLERRGFSFEYCEDDECGSKVDIFKCGYPREEEN